MYLDEGSALTIEKEEKKTQRKPVSFILALHNHQPVGNLPEVFAAAFENAYAPFVEVLKRYPSLKVVLHYSGSLLDWIEKNEPSFLISLRELVEKGQVELMGGGYYEPILPVIPDSDKKGQILKLSRYLKNRLGTEVSGAWLAERIWEPHLARPLFEAGIRYVVVDDAHFQEIGMKSEELLGYYITEEEGCPLKIFPISEKLRYLIPFEKIEETKEFLGSLASKSPGSLAVLADDGEKFGVWPGTHKHVYEEGWLENFFQMLTDNEDWIKTTTFSEYIKSYPPRDRVYLPAASYREMKQWAGGYWRNFLVRYPESNRMHKKMLAVRKRLPQVTRKRARQKARDFIWAAQCNCAYWHGVFGGLYLNFLRAAVYENLIKAENIIVRELHPRDNWLEIKVEDRDYDGFQEIILNNEYYGLLLSPNLGGSLWELSYRPAAVNLLDTLTRRKETYHDDLLKQEIIKNNGNESSNGNNGVKTIHKRFAVKEDGLQDFLVYDRYPRGALLDHFLPPETDLDSFSRGTFTETGDFLLQPYKAEIERLQGKVTVSFQRRGAVDKGELLLRKKIFLETSSQSIKIEYNLQNTGEEELPFKFGSEFNLAFLSGDSPERYYHIPGRALGETHLAGSGEEEEVEELMIFDEWRKLEVALRFSPAARVWRFPIETVSQSEGGLERVYQQSVIVPNWDLTLGSGADSNFNIELCINS
ncbi:MAG: alpha-amylase/4-alpha-glucanotransferase domain-containing protein [Dethiobacteria bacterium]